MLPSCCAVTPDGHDPDRDRRRAAAWTAGADAVRTSVESGARVGPVDAALDRQARRARARAGRRPGPGRPCASKMYRTVLPPPKTKPCCGTGARVAGRALERRDERSGAVLELLDRGRRERVGDGRVERGAEHDQHEQRGEAAPRDEAPADAPDEPRLVGEGRLLRVVVAGVDPSPVSHRRGGTRRRGPSRSATPPPRASCAGSGRRRPPRWASRRR